MPLLQLFALTAFVIPSDTVIKAIGAEGYAAGLIGLFAFAAYLAATLLGVHDPLRHRHPVRAVLCLVWVAILISYVLMDRGMSTGSQLAAADRLIMQFMVITGVALIAAECLNSLRDVRRVLRALTWGGAFCGVVAALQFWASFDLTPTLRMLPGFSLNLETPAILGRAALNRVSGTSLTAIELGVVGGMLLPLALHLAIHDTERSRLKRWAPVVLIGLAIPTSVSRSAIISVVLAFSVFVVLMPVRQRLFAICAAPLAVVGVFMTAPGLIGTLTAFFGAGKDDDSVMARLYDYPEVERLVRMEPVFGHGGGTYLPDFPMYILDNQYLKTAIELGAVGVVVLAAYFLVPMVTALVARRRTSDPELRLLCAALAGAALAAAVCSVTFDSLSFPMFSNLYALVLGMIGASWRLAGPARQPAPEPVGLTFDPPRVGRVYPLVIGVVGAGGRLAAAAGRGAVASVGVLLDWLIGMVRAGGRLAAAAGRGAAASIGVMLEWLNGMVRATGRLAAAAGRGAAASVEVMLDWMIGMVRAAGPLAAAAGRGAAASVGVMLNWMIGVVRAAGRLAAAAGRGAAASVGVMLDWLIGVVRAAGRLVARAGVRATELGRATASMARTRNFRIAIAVATLVGSACGVLLWGPWHGPVVLSLSESHGVDAGDLPALLLIALAVAVGQARAAQAKARPRWWAARLAAPVSAIVVGVLLLLVSVIDTAGGPALVPAGGGTFAGSTQHAGGPGADPVDRWSHLALTYDGAALRLYVDGTEVSSRATTGTILNTTDPLWIGGNRPYGEYFDGVIDEVRIYRRALSPSQVQAAMSRPIETSGVSPSAGLVGAYAFDTGSGTVAADASGNGNAGTISGATWTQRGRFGGALRFDGEEAVVRVPGSASLNLGAAMTLSAWIRPGESQSGWRTVLHRQTDAYFLMAGGGHPREAGAGMLDEARMALLIIAALWFCVALTTGRAPRIGGRRGLYWPPVALFLAGSLVDAALAPSDTLIGPTVVALWCALTASRRDEAAILYLIAAAFTGVTVAAVAGDLELARDEGGIARSAALGLLLVTVALLRARHGSRGGEQPVPDGT